MKYIYLFQFYLIEITVFENLNKKILIIGELIIILKKMKYLFYLEYIDFIVFSYKF
jgi:hypothetical protein